MRNMAEKKRISADWLSTNLIQEPEAKAVNIE